jgi:hypothetical protein
VRPEPLRPAALSTSGEARACLRDISVALLVPAGGNPCPCDSSGSRGSPPARASRQNQGRLSRRCLPRRRRLCWSGTHLSPQQRHLALCWSVWSSPSQCGLERRSDPPGHCLPVRRNVCETFRLARWQTGRAEQLGYAAVATMVRCFRDTRGANELARSTSVQQNAVRRHYSAAAGGTPAAVTRRGRQATDSDPAGRAAILRLREGAAPPPRCSAPSASAQPGSLRRLSAVSLVSACAHAVQAGRPWVGRTPEPRKSRQWSLQRYLAAQLRVGLIAQPQPASEGPRGPAQGPGPPSIGPPLAARQCHLTELH